MMKKSAAIRAICAQYADLTRKRKKYLENFGFDP